MKELVRRVQITYRWHREDDEDIPSDHAEHLESEAEERIALMRREGYVSGELHANIRLSDEPECGVDYRGWWEAKTL